MNSIIFMMDPDLRELLHEWRLETAALKCLEECGIYSIELLKMMHTCDINKIFENRCDIQHKIRFRYNLQKWRLQNHLDVLTCCDSDKTITNTSSSSRVSDWLEREVSNFNLKSILEATVVGAKILNLYKKRHYLEKSEQNGISRIIVDYYLLKNMKMSPTEMARVSKLVVELFPTEHESTYYMPRHGKDKASGKLYDRYLNCLYKNKTAKRQQTECSTIEETISNVEDLNNIKNFLKHNQPSNILDIWSETAHLRMRGERPSLSAIFENWPRYKDPIGTELINIDFEYLHPNKGDKLFTKIDEFMNGMLIIYEQEIKDKLNRFWLDTLKNPKVPTDTKYFHFFNLIHAVIIPPRINSICKPSITDAQKDTIIHLANINNIEQKLNELREVAAQENLTIQPKIFAIGDSIERFTEFYVFLDENIYTVPTLLRAFDLVIKCCLVFNLEYSAKSKYAWILLQEYVYEIPREKKNARITNIINKLKAESEKIKTNNCLDEFCPSVLLQSVKNEYDE